MKNKITTIILSFMLIVLITGIIILGKAMYDDIMGTNQENQVYKITNTSVEEPIEKQNRNLELSNSNISYGNSENTAKANQEEMKVDTGISRYFYNQLSNNQKIIYDNLYKNKENMKQGDYVIEFKEELSGKTKDEISNEQLGTDYQTAIEAFMHDNPDMFFIDANKMYLRIKTRKNIFRTTREVTISADTGKKYYLDDFNDIDEVKLAIKQVEEIKNNIINNLKGSDYDKIMQIHNYLVDNIEYDSTYNAKGSYGIYGALIGKTCTCEGYAKSMKYLLNEAGIKCEIMQGTGTNNSGKTESHAWNCVRLEGIWYLVDATWDDPIITGNGYKTDQFKYRYFLKGTNTFDKDHTLAYQFSEEGKEFEYPIISQRDY